MHAKMVIAKIIPAEEGSMGYRSRKDRLAVSKKIGTINTKLITIRKNKGLFL
jgi:hypothetical protein